MTANGAVRRRRGRGHSSTLDQAGPVGHHATGCLTIPNAKSDTPAGWNLLTGSAEAAPGVPSPAAPPPPRRHVVPRRRASPTGQRDRGSQSVPFGRERQWRTANGAPGTADLAVNGATRADGGAAANRTTSGKAIAAARSTPARSTASTTDTASTGMPARARRPVAETAALAARMEADEPHLTHDELAARLGISTQRLRRIKREVPV